MSFEYLGIEVVGLRHVEVRNDVFIGLVFEHVAVEADVVVVLVVLFVFEVVHDRQFRRIVLQQDLHWHRW